MMRCDRVDFPPGGVAHRHVHPGPGIRRLLFGSLTIEAAGGIGTFGAGQAWFEGVDEPVLATASQTGDTAFVRVLLLPREWAGIALSLLGVAAMSLETDGAAPAPVEART